MGGRVPGNVQGVSLVPAFAGSSVASESSYAETLYPKMNMNWSELRAIRTNHWKYVRAHAPNFTILPLTLTRRKMFSRKMPRKYASSRRN